MSARAVVTAVCAALLGAFVVLPLGLVAARGLADGADALSDLARGPGAAALWNSLIVASGAAALALAFGAPLGAALARLPLRGGKVLGTLLVLPLAAPSYVWAMAWIALAAPRGGWLNRLAAALGHPAPLVDIYGLAGIAFVEGLALAPLVLLPTRAALETADPALEEAARISGASPLRAFVTGSAPLAAPAVASGTLLAFLAAVSSFGVPYLLGVAAVHPRLVATTRIYQALSLGGERDVRSALALGLVLLALAVVAQALSSRLARARPSTGGKGRRPAKLAAPALTRALTLLGWAYAFVAVLVPVGATVLAAFTRRFGDAPGRANLTTAQFANVLGKADVREALVRSAALATLAAFVVVGVSAALGFVRRTRAGRGLARLGEAPYAVPGSVLALALLLAFSQQVRLVIAGRVALVFDVAGTLWLLAIAYAVKHLAFGIRAVGDALRAQDPALEEAARLSGAGPARAFIDVALPLARPALAAAFILVFLPSATELTMSVLLAGPRSQVLGTVLFDLASYADPPSGAVLACVVLALAAAADVTLRKLGAAS